MALGSAFVYQYTDFGDQAPTQNWLSGRVRPMGYFTDSFSIALEGGVDWISNSPSGPVASPDYPSPDPAVAYDNFPTYLLASVLPLPDYQY